MKLHCLLLLPVLSACGSMLGVSTTAHAQASDLIISINGDDGFLSADARRYFNRGHCGLDDGSGGTGGAGGDGATGGVGGDSGVTTAATQKDDPSEVTFTIRLNEDAGEAYLWVGAQGAMCNVLANRNETQGICAEIPGNPRQVGQDNLISGLTLQDLLDARAGANQIVTCDSSGLAGTPFEIFAFRNDAFAGTDAESYGIAEFSVDVTAPNAPNVDTTPQQQANFTISWSQPDPPDDIQSWELFSSDTEDAATATSLGITTTRPDARSLSVSADLLGLAEGESAFVFAAAYDSAFVSDPFGGNRSELSDGVQVTAVPVAGYCDISGQCGGCSVSPMTLRGGTPGSVSWILMLVLALAWAWRVHR